MSLVRNDRLYGKDIYNYFLSFIPISLNRVASLYWISTVDQWLDVVVAISSKITTIISVVHTIVIS